ncbi:unnamed protein product [Ceutorhynchus assimilis]|uniref:Metalloendopeptidase n=1 Tax=Ceutorhynchus assimilis TaxID=467358 RepID=A0A9N9MXT7_9CUCU|nr:unnamed protein product [Ceutorhynchus assimilis]
MWQIGSVFFVAALSNVRSWPFDSISFDDSDDGVVMPDLSYLGERIFRKPSLETGRLLENWDHTSEMNPEEMGEYAEGDIVFPKTARNGLVTESARWPNGEVPYQIDGFFDSDSLGNIKKAISIYHKYTCLKFRKRTASDNDYISIVNSNTGCWSSVGRIGGKQEVNLQSPSCVTRVGTPIHELMHAVGFLHEQNRYERDDYVTIAWQNIRSGHENNFDKADDAKTTGYGVPYDFRSVMHYSGKAFSVNGKPTIIPKDSSKAEKMGQREGFSKGDLTKINKMYNCPEKTDEVTGNNNNIPDSNNNASENKENNSNPLVEAAQGFLGWLFHKK